MMTTVPVLTTNSTNITSAFADIDGKVTSNGGSAVSTQGICEIRPCLDGDELREKRFVKKGHQGVWRRMKSRL